MSTTISGDLYRSDTKDVCELTRKARKYDYRVQASGGGTLRLKIEYRTDDQLGVGADYVKGKWYTLVPRFKTDSGQTTEGSFTLPDTGADGSTRIKFIFSRGLGTKGVDYEFYMEPA